MAETRKPDGWKPTSPNSAVPEAVEVQTGPIVVPRRETGPIRVPQRVTVRGAQPAPAPPMAPTEPAPTDGGTQAPPAPGTAPPIIVPPDELAVLQEMLLELRAARVRDIETQTDMRALRQVLAGPFRFLTFSPQAVNISTPAVIAANDRLSLVPRQTFPGAAIYVAVMLSGRTARIIPTFDGTENPIDVDQLVTFQISEAVAPAGVQVQADPANGRFTTVMNPGAPEGLAFFSSWSLEVQNTGSAAINLLDFLVIMRQYVPLDLFPQLTQLEEA